MLRVPAGGLIISMQSLAGETVRERRRRERRELYELRLAEWYVKLEVTLKQCKPTFIFMLVIILVHC